jgi:hypothetical protein
LEAAGLRGYEAPEPDHLARWYYHLTEARGQLSGLMLELQVLREPVFSVHIEVGADDPLAFLWSQGEQVEDFGEGAPRGMLVTGTGFNIHASDRYRIQRIPGG